MKHQRGFSIVMAIFVLVALGLLGGYMLRLSGVQLGTSIYALQGARAYHAARSGIEWAIARINNGGNCTDVSAQTALSFAGITGFTVKLSCTRLAYFEADKNLSFYRIKALSQFGDYGGNDYVAREIEVTIIK